MHPSPTTHRPRGLLLLVCICVAALAYATPATAGPLCTGGDADLPFDIGDPDADVDSSLTDDSICRNFDVGTEVARYYHFDTGFALDGFDHLLKITVDEVLIPFGLRFDLTYHETGFNFGIAGYECVPYGPPGGSGLGGRCVEYRTSEGPDDFIPVEGVDYLGDVYWLIAWSQPIGTDPPAEIVHAPGRTGRYSILTEDTFFSPFLGPSDYSCDSSDEYGSSYEDPCDFFGEILKVEGDPVRGARADTFSGAGMVQLQQVPEPVTLALFGLGLGGWLADARRRTRGRK